MDTDFESTVTDERVRLASDRTFLVAGALLFVASVGGTLYWWRSMSGGMSMPGGWTLSMVWTTMPGQTWLSAATSFMGMWVVMMAAMMLPSLVPTLLSYRRSVRVTAPPWHRTSRLTPPHPDGWRGGRLGGMSVLAGTGYFFVWAIFGAIAFPLGALLASAEMQSASLARSIPFATGVALLIIGGYQFTAWKARQLRCCREVPVSERWLSPDAHGALRYGLRQGWHCCLCCAGFMVILLLTGVMDLGIMAVVAAAITVERLSPRPDLTTRAAGIVVMLAGVFMIVHAIGMA